jgi:hypothetical protein
MPKLPETEIKCEFANRNKRLKMIEKTDGAIRFPGLLFMSCGWSARKEEGRRKKEEG